LACRYATAALNRTPHVLRHLRTLPARPCQRLFTHPVDQLKLDAPSPPNGTNGRRATMPDAVIALTHPVDLDIAAEGTETEDQARRHPALGYRYAKEYHFARPLPAAEGSTWYRPNLREERNLRHSHPSMGWLWELTCPSPTSRRIAASAEPDSPLLCR
jgi:hypothetical protein